MKISENGRQEIVAAKAKRVHFGRPEINVSENFAKNNQGSRTKKLPLPEVLK